MKQVSLLKPGLSILFMIHCFFGLSQGFTVAEGKLYDANGKEFVPKGVNHPHLWYIRESYKSLDRLAELNVNCVRIVWGTDGTAKDLKAAIDRCIKLEMIPMVELHDGTGNTSAEKLMKLVDYYCRQDIKKILLAREKYLLLNIANEWGDHTTSGEYWKKSYMQAIDSLRHAGYKTTIVIDAPGWGQDIYPVFSYHDDLTAYDPEKNLLFSVHMYFSWNDPEKIKTGLEKACHEKIPLVIGEFGYNYNNGENNLGCRVDHKTILKECHEHGSGYLAWSWTGNNKENAWLNLAEHSDWKTLTRWGKEIFESEYGILKTAKKASVFIKDP
ncbi:MAG: cellulase family glycosylhydrolase [Bacteroidales bacterium]|jgi:mannan endo-1,4-beta-mannosidase